MQLSIAVLCLAACLSCTAAWKWSPHVDLHRHSEIFSEMYRAEHDVQEVAGGPVILNFTQRLNHFDEQDQTTWTQRYAINPQYWNGTGPIFFMINGEGPMDIVSVIGYQYVTWAKEFNALLVSLEHRFYGYSQPFDDLSTKSLKFLNAEQALADAANFIAFITKQNNAQANQVITFGGSYAGMLSGWMRQKYPQLIDASIASSGPVHAEIDFYQYLEVVSASLTTLGGAQCVQNIAAATQKIQALTTTTDGLNALSTQFSTCDPIQLEDIPVFMQSLAGNFMGIVQYNLEFAGTNISTLCDVMTNSSNDPLTNYLRIWNAFLGGECADVSYGDMVHELMNDTLSYSVGGRQWFYQTCVEFGYYQTSDSTMQPFGNLFNVSTQTQMCTDVFGFNFLPDVNWTLTEFGDRDPDASDTLWVNGSIDPWHSLGVLALPTGAPFQILVIQGTAHCADMLPPFNGAPTTLAPAQEVIRQQLAMWISQYQSK